MSRTVPRISAPHLKRKMEEAQRMEEEEKRNKIMRMEQLKKSNTNEHDVDEQCFSDTSSEVEFDEGEDKIVPIPEKCEKNVQNSASTNSPTSIVFKN